MNMYRNHNTAYYPWQRRKTENCRTIPDAGCGDGSLARFLDDGTKKITGTDPDIRCIERADSLNESSGLRFSCCSFEDHTPDMRFDAIVFVASIHHMDMTEALRKAKALLSPSGKLLIVDLAAPSSITDRVVEAARAIPSKVISALHRMQTSEELNLPVVYDYPRMIDIRNIVKKELPGARIRYGLHYRYLLEREVR